MRNHARSVALATTLLACALPGTVAAQGAYVDSACGAWIGDRWVSNRTCQPDVHRHERIAGTIVAVKGHLIAVARSGRNVTVDDTPAFVNRMTGRIATGRLIVAHGYWDAGRFYATMIFTRAGR